MLTIVFVCGVLMSGLALSRLLNYTTQAELRGRALMLMEAMNSVRGYTSEEVRPELADRLEVEFLPQTVPSYSAQSVFARFRADLSYQDFQYREAALNPTNPKDKADAFETNLVEEFRQQADLKEMSGLSQWPRGANVLHCATHSRGQRKLPDLPQHCRARSQKHDRTLRYRWRVLTGS